MSTSERRPRFSPSAGIAIGPILFILAMLALIGTIMASGGNDFQISSVTDRVAADIGSQANLIRSTINNCNLQYQLALSIGSVSATDGYPTSDANGTAVADLKCDPMGISPLWGDNGGSGVMMPPPTQGFAPWAYVNGGAAGGRCVWTQPTAANPLGDTGTVTGLKRAAAKFNSSSTISSAYEVTYDPAKAAQKFVVWITTPANAGSANSHCQP